MLLARNLTHLHETQYEDEISISGFQGLYKNNKKENKLYKYFLINVEIPKHNVTD